MTLNASLLRPGIIKNTKPNQLICSKSKEVGTYTLPKHANFSLTLADIKHHQSHPSSLTSQWHLHPCVYTIPGNHGAPSFMHCSKKPVTIMLTYPWKCTVLHCNHLGNTWKPLVLMTRHVDYCPSARDFPPMSGCLQL